MATGSSSSSAAELRRDEAGPAAGAGADARPLFFVVYRACEAVAAVHGKPRPFGLDKPTLVRIAFESLVRALRGHRHRIVVVGDRIGEDARRFFERRGADVVAGSFGNGASLARAIEIGLAAPEGSWVYLCEDDYLHLPFAFDAFEDLVVRRREILAHAPKPRWLRLLAHRLEERPLVVCPDDPIGWYHPRKRRPSYLFVGSHTHWRQTTRTCFTLLLERATLARYARLFRAVAPRADDGRLSRELYGGLLFTLRPRRALAVAPVPALAAHLHEETLSPLRDWEGLVRALREELARAGELPPGTRAGGAEREVAATAGGGTR